MSELKELSESFAIMGPDHDGIIWLALTCKDKFRLMLYLGKSDDWFASRLVEFEQRRQEALEEKRRNEMSDETRSISEICNDIEAKDENEASIFIDLVAAANVKLNQTNAELLEALELMLETVPPYKENGTCTIPDRTIQVVNKAIAKAKGKADGE